MDVNYLDGIYVQMGDESFKTRNACGLGNLIIGKTIQLLQRVKLFKLSKGELENWARLRFMSTLFLRCTKLHIFLNGQHMSFEHQKVIAASTAALMSISSSVPEIQLQPAVLKQYVV